MMTSTTQKSSWLTKEAGEAQREWYVVDATGHTLGRLASRIAMVLRGKHKATYTPNVDMGDFVIVLNAGAAKLTGAKPDKKLYRHHTLYPGGIRTRLAKEVLATDPERAIREAVWGMMPKGPLGRRVVKKLKIYKGGEHEHAAQKPRVLEVSPERTYKAAGAK
jgi:large subunit ribosomal protein L13